MKITSRDRWVALGILVALVLVCLIIGYAQGMQSCAGISFGFF